MTFNGLELSAIVKMAVAMAKADDRFDENEKQLIADEMNNFNVSFDDFSRILANAENMNATTAFSIISAMSQEQKKYVTGYLAAVMAVDGVIADDEVKMWCLISSLANLPNMSAGEAIDFWRRH